MSFTLHGLAVSKGIAIGPAHLAAHQQVEVTEYVVAQEHLAGEVHRFEQALASTRQQLCRIRDELPADAAADIAAFIDPHLLMLDDSMLAEAPVALIEELRCNAEWALKLQRDKLIGIFEAMEDPYLRARQQDVDQVINRIQFFLLGLADPTRQHIPPPAPGTNSIIVADDLTPADTANMPSQGIFAFVTEFGGPSSHTAILARSLGIPAIVGVRHVRRYIRPNDTVIIDGYRGVVLIDPDPKTLRHYRNRRVEDRRYRAELGKLRPIPTVTLDGIPITLHANIEFPDDVAAVKRAGSNGIGLYRTEFLYMNRDNRPPPNEEEHFEAYLKVVQAMRGGQVTIRTLDLGADKQVDGVSSSNRPLAANPALGLRAVRMCLKELDLFRAQLRAIARVSQHGSVRMMIPMVSGLHEVFQVKHLLNEVRQELIQQKIKFDPHMPVGVMVEIPSVAVCTDLFTPHVDFLSIGTNDLIQYTLAIDRVDTEVNYLYDPLHPAVLRLLKMTIKHAQKAGKPISMCGEMAGDPQYVRLLLGLGLRSFSVNPETLLEVKKLINTTRVSSLQAQIRRVLKLGSSADIADIVDKMNRR